MIILGFIHACIVFNYSCKQLRLVSEAIMIIWETNGLNLKSMLHRQCCQTLSYLLFLWLFPSCRVAGMTDDLSSPNRPVRLLARSQSSTFQISLTCIFPSCFWSSSLLFPWYIRSHHFPPYVFAISPHHMPVPVQSSLVIFLEACATLVVPRMCSFLILSLSVTPHIHRSILISVTSIRFSCLFVVAHVSAPYTAVALLA